MYTGPIPAIARSLYAEYKKAQTSKHFDLGAVSQDDPRADEFAGGVAGWVMPALVEPVDGRWWDKYGKLLDVKRTQETLTFQKLSRPMPTTAATEWLLMTPQSPRRRVRPFSALAGHTLININFIR